MANAAVVLAGLVFFLASVGARAHVLLDWPALRTGLDTFFQFAAFGAFLVLLVRRPLWAITLGLTYLLLLTNAFWSLYWPSLRPGIPVQDFLLANDVSANYSWDQAVVYLKTTGVMLTIGLAARVSWPFAGPRARALFAATVFSAIGLNLLVIAIQGAVDVQWLAAGSGTAVGHGRTSGLLEDSGASTVYAAAVLSGTVFVAMFARLSSFTRLFSGAAALAGAAAGVATGGMVYFLSLAATVAMGVGLLLIRCITTLTGRLGLAAVGLAGLGGGAWATLGPAALTNPLPAIHAGLLALDPIRLAHQKVMLRALWEHPWLGTGFGWFYANLHEFGPWAVASGGAFFSDVPTSMYLMLASELGAAGILAVVAGLGWLATRCVRLTRATAGEETDVWTAFAVGASVSLAVSFLVGIHLIFWSVPALAIPIAIGGATETVRGRRWFAAVWGTALVVIAISCVKLWATAPRAPEFRWKERGTPQIPVSLVVPIWPAGLEGIWASSGAEFLFEGKPLWFHIERPAEFYPMTFTIQVFDRGGRQVASNEQVFELPTDADSGRLIQVPFDNDVNSLCAANITPEDYCTFRITTTPEWTLDKQPVAVLYVTRNLR
ncbi:MAG: hypothetical protein FJW21_12530 [Acidimicrobiia bacterium]|nr:hypothetical protein [Acidimicrobiia bacterium]